MDSQAVGIFILQCVLKNMWTFAERVSALREMLGTSLFQLTAK